MRCKWFNGMVSKQREDNWVNSIGRLLRKRPHDIVMYPKRHIIVKHRIGEATS
jgi:hypothetical protein